MNDPKARRPVRIALVDDHEVVRQGLRVLIEHHLRIQVVEAKSADDAVRLGLDPSINLVMLDIRRGDGDDGLMALRRLKKERPSLPVVMLSTFDEYARQAVEMGADGYLLKDATIDQVRIAIDTALSNGTYLHPGVADKVLSAPDEKSRTYRLTERERQILGFIARGEPNSAIANTMNVSEATIKSHLTAIYRKLKVSNRTQAAAIAHEEGLTVAIPD